MSKYKINSRNRNGRGRDKANASFVRRIGLLAEDLRQENDFYQYLLKLKGFAGRYCVMVAAMDTPVGPYVSAAHAKALMDIGTKIDLCEKYRAAYVAVINAGELVYEEISAQPIEKPYRSMDTGLTF